MAILYSGMPVTTPEAPPPSFIFITFDPGDNGSFSKFALTACPGSITMVILFFSFVFLVLSSNSFSVSLVLAASSFSCLSSSIVFSTSFGFLSFSVSSIDAVLSSGTSLTFSL